MAFEKSGWRGIGGFNREFKGGQLFSYVNLDDVLFDIKGSGYFDEVASALGVNDRVLIFGSDSSELTYVLNPSIPTSVESVTTNRTTENLTDGGNLSLRFAIAELTTTTASAFTIGNGNEYQEKIITLIVDGGDATLAITGGIGFTQIVFADAGDSVFLKFLSTGWAMIGKGGPGVGPVVT